MEEEIMDVVHKKYRLLGILLVVLFISYFALPFTLTFFPDMMNRKTIVAGLSIIWIYTFLQIPFTWILGWIYYRKVEGFDTAIRLLKNREA